MSDLETRLVMSVEDFLGDASAGAAIHKRQGVGTVPGYADDGGEGVGNDAANRGVGLEVFESHVNQEKADVQL